MATIEGVLVTDLPTSPDRSGYSRDIIINNTPLAGGSIFPSIRMSYPNVIDAFFVTVNHDQVWYCAQGMVQAVLYDRRTTSTTRGQTQTILMGHYIPVALFIPRGIVYGYKVVGLDLALLVRMTSSAIGSDERERIAHTDADIGYSWDVQVR